MKKTILLMISMLFVVPLHGDVIEMKDGVSGNAEILDTIGCRQSDWDGASFSH